MVANGRALNTKLRLDISEYVKNLKVAGAATQQFARTVEQSAARASAATAKMNQQMGQQQQRSSKTRMTQAQIDQQAMNRLHEQAFREDAARTRAAAQQRITADRSMARAHEQALRENAARDASAAKSAQRMNQLHAEALRENANRQAQADRAAAQAANKRAGDIERVSKAAMVGGVLLVAGWAVAVNTAMKFEKQISAVGAAANATGKDLDALREAALEAGAATAFSATEAAQGEEELAKAGVSVEHILSGGLRGALDLASAGQLSVAESAEIAATAMTQFGLKGNQVPHIADLLSAGANKAQGNVHQLGMAMKMGGLVASQFGWSIEETVGTLAMFAKAGLVGSDSGTSMKQMLLMLVNPTKKAAALMDELGIKTYDASGHFLHAQDLAGQLQTRLGHLSEEQRNQALATIFGADAIRGASIAFKNGADGVKLWENNVNDAGNAARTAEAKLDNLAGDLEKLKGSLEVAFIKSGSSSMGTLRVLTQAAESMVDGFVAAPPALQNTATALAAVTGAALLAAGAYGVMAPKIRAASAALVGLGAAGKVANTALIGVGKYGGVALGAIVGLSIVGAVADQFAAAAPNVDRLTRSLEAFAKTGQVSGEMSRVFEGNLGRLKDGFEFIRNSGGMRGAMDASGIEKAFILPAKLSFSVTKHLEEIDAFDKALAGMVSSGHAQEAAAALGRVGLSAKDAADFLPGYTGALEAAKDATAKAATSLETAGGKARVMASGMEAAIKETGSLDKALKGLNDTAMSSFDAQNAYQLGLNKLTGALKENHHAWAGNTTAAVENRQAVGDLIKQAQDKLAKQYEEIAAAKGQTAAMAATTASYQTMRAQIINAAVAAGINRAAVTALVDQLLQVPSNTPAAVTTPGIEAARQRVIDFRKTAESIQKTYIATIEAHGTISAAASINNAKAVAEAYERNYVANIVTNKITREQYFKSPTVQGPYPGQRWGGVHSFSAGGAIRAHVARNQIVRYAEPETGGEAFIPRRGDPARSMSILAEAASWYGAQLSTGSSMSGASMAAPASSAGGGNTYNLNVTVPRDAHPASVGREIVQHILAYESKGGGTSWRTRR